MAKAERTQLKGKQNLREEMYQAKNCHKVQNMKDWLVMKMVHLKLLKKHFM